MERSADAPNQPVIEGYRALTPIAEGGFSSVYTAHQIRFSRTVAVKVLHADARDPAAFQRFQHECEMTGRLTGRPHVITVFDAGVTVDGQPFIAMQHLPNGSLSDRLQALGPLPAMDALHVGVAIAGALSSAHRAGILHRDVKPANILISDDGEPVLSDFGIAGLAYPSAGREAVAAFTLSHAAPEVLGGRPSSARSDIYMLGSTLYMLLTGVPPFGPEVDQRPTERILQIRDRPLADLNRQDVSPDVFALLRSALAFEPAGRPSSADLLADRLTELLAAHQGGAQPYLAPGVAAPSDRTVDLRWSRPGLANPTDPAVTSTRRSRPSRSRTIAVVAAVVAVVALGGVIAFRTMTNVPGIATAASPGPPGHTVGTVSTSPPTTTTTAAPATTTTVLPTTTAQRPATVQPGTHPPAPPPTGMPSTMPASPNPTGVFYITGGDVVMAAGTGHGCKAWMNGRNPGPYAQGLIESWGNDCEMTLWRSTDGGASFHQLSGPHRLSSGTATTDFYWDGGGYQAKVCLQDYTTKEYHCGSPYGG